jgi:prophage regulatory protein
MYSAIITNNGCAMQALGLRCYKVYGAIHTLIDIETQMEPTMELTEDRIIMAKERRQLVPYSDVHIYRLEKAGKFPRRIKLNPNGRVGWSHKEVVGWIAEKKAQREAA